MMKHLKTAAIVLAIVAVPVGYVAAMQYVGKGDLFDHFGNPDISAEQFDGVFDPVSESMDMSPGILRYCLGVEKSRNGIASARIRRGGLFKTAVVWSMDATMLPCPSGSDDDDSPKVPEIKQ